MNNATEITVSDFIAMTCPTDIKWVGICRDNGERCVFVRSGQKEVKWLSNVDADTAVAAKRYAQQKFKL